MRQLSVVPALTPLRRHAVGALLSLVVSIALSARAECAESKLDLGRTSPRARWDESAGSAFLPVGEEPAEIVVVPPDERLRVAFVGDGLIEGEARSGYLETELTRLHPDHDIVFRNLGWTGDTVDGSARTGFGPDEHKTSSWQPPSRQSPDYGFRRMFKQLARDRPDVVFVGYGSNLTPSADEKRDAVESHGRGLNRLLDALEPIGVRVVLLSPVPRQPSETEHGSWTGETHRLLESIARLTQKIATERGHAFVDLFGAFVAWHAEEPEARWSTNGMHLDERGYRKLAAVVVERLELADAQRALELSVAKLDSGALTAPVEAIEKSPFGWRFRIHEDRLPSLSSGSPLLRIEGLPQGAFTLDIGGERVARASAEDWAAGVPIRRGPDLEQTERLRRVIVMKSALVHHELRPQNKAYIHLFRRHERGHHEGELAQFAAEVLEREEEIARLRRPRTRGYEIVRETDYPDHEVPGAVPPPDVAAELAEFIVDDALEVNVFAADPLVVNPIHAAFDERRRLWVATSTIYPHLAPRQEPNDRILILEDVDGDGRADMSTVFADGLLVPQSVLPTRGGAWVAQSTDLLRLVDHDGDDRVDETQVVLSGFGVADVHHMIHGLRWGPDGDLYFTQSIYINSFVETPWGIRRLNGSGTWRLRPESLRLEVHSRGLVNPWGFAFDRFGQPFSTDGAGGGGPAHTFAGSAYPTAKDAERTLRTMNPGRPKECGLEIVSGRHLAPWEGDLITSDFRANRVVRYRLTDNGSGYTSKLLGDVLASPRRSFRPVDVKIGPDGALYVVDWFSPIIDHGEVDFHHPLRDRHHGRIWRLTMKGRETYARPRLEDADVEGLASSLASPDAWTRGEARRLLRERGGDAVISAVREVASRSAEELPPELGELARLEAVWALQGLRTFDATPIRTLLAAEDARLRAAAVRVVADGYSRIEGAQALLARAVEDPHARVRLEAVNALAANPDELSAEIALRALDRGLDAELDFALWRAVRELESFWRPALESGRIVFAGDPDRLAFALAASGGRASLAPLVDLVRGGELREEERDSALALIAMLGTEAERAIVLEIALGERSGSTRRVRLLQSLDRAAERGRAPPTNAARVRELLADGSDEELRLAARLAGRWKVRESLDALIAVTERARLARRPTLLRESVGAIGRVEDDGATLARWLDEGSADARRPAVIAAWAERDAEEAARPAVAYLREDPSELGVEWIFEVFLAREGAAEALTRALDGVRLDRAVASLGVRLASSSGREMGALVAALSRAGRLEPVRQMPQGRELSAMLVEAASRGDPARGEEIFRRETLRCMTCHAIGGAGGKVGPDLSSLGGSAQPVHLLEAVLAPSEKIKEGFETVVVVDALGGLHSGVIVKGSSDAVQVRDANDRTTTIPASSVVAVQPSAVSLMPAGLVDSLRRDELVDLLRFLSDLGRPGPYSLPTARFVRDWAVSAGVADGGEAESRRVFSRVDGSLPLADLQRAAGASGEGAISLRFTLDEPREAALVGEWIDVDSSGARLRVGDRAFRAWPRDGRATIPAGPVEIELRIASVPVTGALRIRVEDDGS